MYGWTSGPSSLSILQPKESSTNIPSNRGRPKCGGKRGSSPSPSPAPAVVFAVLSCLLDHGLWPPGGGGELKRAEETCLLPRPCSSWKVPIASCFCVLPLLRMVTPTSECTFQGAAHTWLPQTFLTILSHVQTVLRTLPRRVALLCGFPHTLHQRHPVEIQTVPNLTMV